MKKDAKISAVLLALVVVFLALAAVFHLNLWGRQAALPKIPLVDTNFFSTATVRTSYAEMVRKSADMSDFDCYACHDKKTPPPLRFDTNHNLIIPKEHSNIVMGHGQHNRNNLCYNCHDDENLELLQTRDGRKLKMSESTPLCGSCHGPTYRDWEAGSHGRKTGFWSPALGPVTREDCVSCHDPHSPGFPSRPPAPGPHPLRAPTKPTLAKEGEH